MAAGGDPARVAVCDCIKGRIVGKKNKGDRASRWQIWLLIVVLVVDGFTGFQGIRRGLEILGSFIMDLLS